jgi:hypothetical protein
LDLLPPLPAGGSSPDVEARFASYLSLSEAGHDLTTVLRQKKARCGEFRARARALLWTICWTLARHSAPLLGRLPLALSSAGLPQPVLAGKGD